jgi:hypothetical protein
VSESYLSEQIYQYLGSIERYYLQRLGSLEEQYRYFGDPELTIKKNSHLCDKHVAKENYCLVVNTNINVELVSLYSVEDNGCGQLIQCDKSVPIYSAYGTQMIVGYECSYVLQPGRTYFMSYVRYGIGPLLRFKKFRVIDPEHVEILDEWKCYGPQCLAPDQYGLLKAAEVVKRMCEGGGKA